MPPVPIAVAAGTAAAAAGASAVAAAAVTAAISGAIYGAVIGFATAVISGGDPLQGALKGAGLGAVGGAVMGGASAAAGTSVGVAGTEVAGAELGHIANAGGSNIAGAEMGHIANAAGSAAKTAAIAPPVVKPPPSPTSTSLFGGHGAEILGNSVAGAGKALLEDRTAGKEIDALMERDRLNREAIQIKGLSQTTSPTLPKIDKFAAKPDWQNLFA